jgi:formate hydrogenlyase subunit 4
VKETVDDSGWLDFYSSVLRCALDDEHEARRRAAGRRSPFLFWLMLMMWMTYVSMSTASAYIAPLKAGPLRSVMLHVGVFVALVVLLCKIGAILNDASLSDISDAQARNGNLLGIGLFAALIAANLALIARQN